MRNEAIPESETRVLNDQAIRDEWNLKKRQHEDEDGRDGPGGKRWKTTTTSGQIAGSGKKEKFGNSKEYL